MAVCVLTLLAGACFGETTPLTSPLMTPDDATLSKNSSKQEDIAQLVARGMALALGDSATRGAIRDLLRNSPNAYQAIHLQSYLEGTAGTTLTHAIANALQMPPAAFLAKLNSLPPLAFGMPPIADRVTWSGGADIDVAGTAKSRDELLSSPTLLAFGPGGAARELDASSTQRQRPVLIISPAPIDFGPDPEARRLKAKKRPKSGADQPIASPGGGVGVMLYTCEDNARARRLCLEPIGAERPDCRSGMGV